MITFRSAPVRSAFPPLLVELALDMFAVVEHWRPPTSLSGPERGRLFERRFARYCAVRKLPLTEGAGSRTLNGVRAASLLAHECDAVISTPDFIIHIEQKHLSGVLGKNELLVFNQKGLDFLYANNAAVRRRPLHRMILSAGILSEGARRFALQWGITVVEPGRVPLVALHGLVTGTPLNFRLTPAEREAICAEVPRLIVPLQQRARQFARGLDLDGDILSPARVARALDVQANGGIRIQRLLAAAEPGWVLKRCDLFTRELAA